MTGPSSQPRCLDCGEALGGRFCAACGQRAEPLHKSLREFVSELSEGLTNFDAKLWRTLPALLLRPGFLTAEFNAGRRTRYVHPLRVYFFVTFIFFGLFSIFGNAGTLVQRSPDPAVAAERDAAVTSPIEHALTAGVIKLAHASDKELSAQLAQRLPQVMFLFLPVAAMLLLIVYPRRHSYVEHLVFVTHVHSFVFVVMSVFLLLPTLPFELSQLVPLVTMFGYFAVALKRTYGQGLAVTAAKALVLAGMYSVVLTAGIVATLLLVVASM